MNNLTRRLITLEHAAAENADAEIIVLNLSPKNWREHKAAINAAGENALVITLTTFGDEVGAPEDYRLYKEAFQAITANNN